MQAQVRHCIILSNNLLLGGLALLMLLVSPVNAELALPTIPKAVKGEQCVEPTDVMRRNHMDMLMHQRDKTLRQGIRTKKHSLNECLTCHAVKDAQQQFVTYDNDKHFCKSCHGFAAVKIDCFDCHTSTPGDEKRIGQNSL